MFMLASVTFSSMGDMSSKLIFMYLPNLNIYYFMVVRATFQLFLFSLIINKQAKVILWDCLNKETIGPLLINMFATTYMYFAFYLSIKDIPMMLTITVCNMSPILTVVFAAIFLRERITPQEIFCIFVAFFGIFVLVTGGAQKADDLGDENKASDYSNMTIFSFLILFSVPCCAATLNCVIR